MNEEAQEKVWQQIRDAGNDTLTGDERRQLEKLLSIPLMHKVLGAIIAASNSQATQLLSIDFSDPKEAHRGSRIQGNVGAAIGLVNMIMALTESDEEETDE